MTAATDTAHAVRDATWTDPEARAEWERPEPAVVETALALRLAGARRAATRRSRISTAARASLPPLVEGFEILSLAQHDHGTPGNWHWRLVAERR